MTGRQGEPVTTTHGAREELSALAERTIAAGEGPPSAGPDPVNLPMIRHWTQAMGDANPLYTDAEYAASTPFGGIVAPPAMIQVWTMAPPDAPPRRDAVGDLLDALDAHGYTGVVATNCEQTYHRHLRLGERVSARTRLSGLTGPKTTALGEGYFVTWNTVWTADGDEPVAEMLFRVLKFRPRERPAGEPEGGGREPYPLRPAVNRDTEFFWEGVRAGELRIQKCGDCGELRHPPGPVCPSCRSTNRTYAVASGVGEVFSHVVHHHPPVPGLEPPFAVAVVRLPEGVRIVGNVVDCPPGDVHIGMPVRVTFRRMDDELILPLWTPRES
jgi:uncharacterized OB-fold protein